MVGRVSGTLAVTHAPFEGKSRPPYGDGKFTYVVGYVLFKEVM